jgi:hypothetical protein
MLDSQGIVTIRHTGADIRMITDCSPSLHRVASMRPVLTVMLLCVSCSRAGSGGPSIAGKGQGTPVYTLSDTAALFAPGVIATGAEFGASFTSNGRTVYVTRLASEGAGTQIVQSTWTGSAWGPAQRAPFSTGARDQYPHLSPDGNRLLFSAPRRRSAALGDADGDWDIWSVRLEGGAEPVREASSANTSADEQSPSLSFEKNMYYVRAPRGDTAASALMYWSPKLRSVPIPVSIGGEITRPQTPFVNRTGRVLLLSARSIQTRAQPDLFVLVRRGDGVWSAPRPLGFEVNSTDAEFAPSLSPDERYLFFSRAGAKVNGVARTDLYVVPVQSVPVLRAALAERP